MKHDVFYTSVVREVTWYEQLYNRICLLFDLKTCTLLYLHSHISHCPLLSSPEYAEGLCLGRFIWCKGYISVVHVRNSFFSRISSASCIFSVKPISFIIPIDVQSTYSWQIMSKYGINVSPRRTLSTTSKKCVSPFDEWTFTFLFFIKNNNGCHSFFKKTIR